MIKSELVSIIIPCYNQMEYLEEAVKSTINQTYTNLEIIIVNDGCTDNTQELAEELQKNHPKKIKILQQKNMGLSEARNNGIRKASGQYILCLDADDILDIKMISRCMDAMIKNNIDIVHGGLQCFEESDNIWIGKPFSENNILYENILHQSSLYKKDVWSKTKGYKKNMKEGYEDWEFWINAYNHNFIFYYLPEILYYYRIKKVSMYTESLKMDAYLKAKIIMNHPELYVNLYVQKAMITIKEVENLPDLYFFYDKKTPEDEKSWLTQVGYFIENNPLKEKQVIIINNQKIGLCSLELWKENKSLQKIYKEMDITYLIFYASIQYEMGALKNSIYSWNKGEGIIKAEGNSFPFISKLERESIENQLIAYQLLNQYKIKVVEPRTEKQISQYQVSIKNRENTITGKEYLIDKLTTMNEKQRNTIENRNRTIQGKVYLIDKLETINEKQKQTIKNRENTITGKISLIEKQKHTIENQKHAMFLLTRIKFISNPIEKYKAYKNLKNVINESKS